MLNAMSEDSKVSRDLKPSRELLETIATAKEYAINAIGLVKKAYDLAIRDGFKPQEARVFLMAELPFISERTIRKALPDEAKDQSKVRTDFAATLPQKPEQNNDNIVNITTKANIQDADLVSKDPPPEEEEEEEPTELELARIEIAQLKDALKKMMQFQPANGQTQTFPPEPLQDEQVFEYLRKRENRINIFYYDNYGIDLIASRLLAQLKNSGVKTFKRLYFEV